MTISAVTTSITSISTVTNTQVRNRIAERAARPAATPRAPVPAAPVDTYSYPLVSASPATSKLAAATWNIRGAD